MKYDFVDNFNKLEIRKCKKSCSCKVCDKEVIGKDIVYLKSFRLHAQPFHICLDCWKKINKLVDEYENKVKEDEQYFSSKSSYVTSSRDYRWCV